MKIKSLSLFSFFIIFKIFSTHANADVFLGGAWNYRLEKEVNGYNYKLKNRLEGFIAYERNKNFDVFKLKMTTLEYYLSYSVYSESSQEGNSKIDLTSEEYIFWLKSKSDINWLNLDYYLGSGIGMFRDRVESHLGADNIKTTSRLREVFGLLFEARYNPHPRYFIASDFKILYSPRYCVRPTIDISLIRLGFSF